jgi:hypothetical protein
MPIITIYLNEELWEFVKAEKSKIIQQAIREMMHRKRLALNNNAIDAPALPD